jgi:hypothetical protein
MALLIKKFLKINGLAGFIDGKFWGLCIQEMPHSSSEWLCYVLL